MNHIVHGHQKYHQVNIATNFIAIYNVARMLVEEHVLCMQVMTVAILYQLILGEIVAALRVQSKGGNFVLKKAKVVRQPGDGSCLFHSLCYGLSNGTRASTLRREIANFIAKNPRLKIADSPLSDWIKWESNSSVKTYASRMSRGGWGGGIEMAAFSHLYKVNVHVYEKKGGMFSRSSGFRRISCFNVNKNGKTVHILYGGRV